MVDRKDVPEEVMQLVKDLGLDTNDPRVQFVNLHDALPTEMVVNHPEFQKLLKLTTFIIEKFHGMAPLRISGEDMIEHSNKELGIQSRQVGPTEFEIFLAEAKDFDKELN